MGKGIEDGINRSKELFNVENNTSNTTNGQSGFSNDTGIDNNSIDVVAQKDGVVTVTCHTPNPTNGAIPTISRFTYYNPSLYGYLNYLSIIKIR